MSIAFVQAKNYTPASRTKIDLIVIHDMEYPEKLTAAEDVARYFANQPKSTKTGSSAHYCIDTDSIVQCVREDDVAWHAPGANSNGIGLEHAGYAAQRPEDWGDAYSQQELSLSAALSAQLCRKYQLPMEFVGVDGLKAGKRGITTHAAVSQAFKRSTHTDPGVNFPMNQYINMVKNVANPVVTQPARGATVAVNRPPVKRVDDPQGRGYWVITDDGGVFSFAFEGKELPFYGSLGGTPLNRPIMDAGSSTGNGYWMMGADGGIFGFGDEKFAGRIEFIG